MKPISNMQVFSGSEGALLGGFALWLAGRPGARGGFRRCRPPPGLLEPPPSLPHRPLQPMRPSPMPMAVKARRSISASPSQLEPVRIRILGHFRQASEILHEEDRRWTTSSRASR